MGMFELFFTKKPKYRWKSDTTRSHVDARGSQVSSVEQIVGGEGNPVAGILDEPKKS